jgi:hypothetical protein
MDVSDINTRKNSRQSRQKPQVDHHHVTAGVRKSENEDANSNLHASFKTNKNQSTVFAELDMSKENYGAMFQNERKNSSKYQYSSVD